MRIVKSPANINSTKAAHLNFREREAPTMPMMEQRKPYAPEPARLTPSCVSPKTPTTAPPAKAKIDAPKIIKEKSKPVTNAAIFISIPPY